MSQRSSGAVFTLQGATLAECKWMAEVQGNVFLMISEELYVQAVPFSLCGYGQKNPLCTVSAAVWLHGISE